MTHLVLSADWMETWRRWAALGAGVTDARRQMRDWRPVAQMVNAAKEILKDKAKRLRSLLEQSDSQLQPWGDPLLVDLGMHRWLADDREEAYSDWLAWVVEQLKTPDRVFRLFGRKCLPEWSARSTSPVVYRELVVPYGHVGHEGRLDLLIDYGLPLLAVEVKKGGAEQADLEKHEGYRRSLEEKYPTKKPCLVLLVTSGGEAASKGGFGVRTWAAVCVELRRMAADELKKCLPRIAVALILAFVAAVEQNLLGFSSNLIRRIKQDEGDSVYFFNTNVVDHIAASLLPEVPS